VDAPGRAVARLCLAVSALALAACATVADSSGPTPVLHWYNATDGADVHALAKACSAASDGAYSIDVEPLPADAVDRHAQLVRTLLTADHDIDLLSLESPLTAEIAAAGVLAPVPGDLVAGFSEDVFPVALEAATVDDRLVAAPWWFDPYLLWFRGTLAERAGLDVGKPISWDALLEGADVAGVTVQVDDPDGHGLADWLNALVVGAGGSILDGGGRDAAVGLDTEAARAAFDVIDQATGKGASGPSADAVTKFASVDGGFLVAPSSVISDPALLGIAGDLSWAPYPVMGDEPVAPLTGAALAVPAAAAHRGLSWDAITCLTSPDSLAALTTISGHSASRASTYDLDAVAKAYPMAAVTRAAVEHGVALPSSSYWQLVEAGLLEAMTPLADVHADTTPAAAQRAVKTLLKGTP